MNLGNKIRSLRKARGITQEQLADSIGISFQAISKWENNIALPDITLAPALASYFGITMDELFEYNLKEIEGKVKAICDEAYKYRESNPIKSRAILEDGLKIYPDNDVLLNNLLYVLDYTNEPDKVISVASMLIDNTTQDDIKYDALRCLADAYKQKGDMKSAAAAIEQIPEIYFSKLSVAAWILTGKQKYDAAEKQKWIAFEDLLQMMGKIAECLEEDEKYSEALSETERALKLIETMTGEPKINNFNEYVDSMEKKILVLKKKAE